MTPRQASYDQHRLKEKIEKEEIQTTEGREIEEKESRETRCLIEGHPCLVAFVY